MAGPVLIIYTKSELATEIPVKMVVLLIVAAVAVDRDMAERVVAKVSASHSESFPLYVNLLVPTRYKK